LLLCLSSLTFATLLEATDDTDEHPLPPASEADVPTGAPAGRPVVDREGVQGHHYIREELSGFFWSCLTTTNRQDRLMAAGIPGNFVGFNFGFFF